MPVLLVTSLFACRDEDAVRIPESGTAPNFRLVLRPDNSFFNVADLSTAKLIYDIYSVNYNDIESAEISLRYLKAGNPACNVGGCLGPFVVRTYTKSDLAASGGIIKGEEITIQELLTVLDLEEADIAGGDQFLFSNVTTMTNGNVYPTAITHPSIAATTNVLAIYGTTGANFTSAFGAVVGCPFDQDAMVGDWTLTADSWEVAKIPVGSTLEVVAGPGATQFTVLDAFGFGFDMVVDVNPSSGAATVAKQEMWDPLHWGMPASYGKGYATAGAANGSNAFSCIGKVTFKFSYTVDAGSFAGVHNYTIEKQ